MEAWHNNKISGSGLTASEQVVGVFSERRGGNDRKEGRRQESKEMSGGKKRETELVKDKHVKGGGGVDVRFPHVSHITFFLSLLLFHHCVGRHCRHRLDLCQMFAHHPQVHRVECS